MKESRVLIDSYYSYDTISAMLFDAITTNINKVYTSPKYKELTMLENANEDSSESYLELFNEIQNVLDDYSSKQVLVLDVNKFIITNSFDYIGIPSTYSNRLSIYNSSHRPYLKELLNTLIQLNSSLKWETNARTLLEGTLLLEVL